MSKFAKFCLFLKSGIKKIKMHEKYVIVNDVPTHIMSWGKGLDDEWPEAAKEAIVCVTGNPGLPGFYTSFLSTMHTETEGNIPIFCIGQAGHDDPPEGHELLPQVPALENNHDLYNLQGQINHKAEFINKYIPANVKINFIGHSVGSWEILELIKIPEIDKRVHKCYLLFPTIERMLESKNGFILKRILDPIFFVIQIFYRLFNLLPYTIKVFLVSVYFWVNDIPKHFTGTAIKYTKPCVIDKIWFLALDEMEKIKDLDVDNVRKNLPRLKFYYGMKDQWVPKKYYDELLEKFPNIDAELCSQEMEHAFVVQHSPQMARMVVDWINKDKLK